MVSDRNKLIDTALELLETIYVHLPLKRSMYAVNPLQRLKLLSRRTEQPKPALSTRDFLNELLSIFCELRDLHTSFVLPEPLRSSTAFLPFRLQRCVSNSGEELYLVTQIMAEGLIDPDFQVGVRVTHWNGTPIDRVVAANADREAGSNPAARRAQGLNALTIRWLGQSLLPDEEWVDIVFLPLAKDAPKQIRFEWKVFQRDEGGSQASATAITRAQGSNIFAVGMDARGESERQIRRHLFEEGRKKPAQVGHFDIAETSVTEWAQDVFPVCSNVTTSLGVFGYIRIATFNVDDEKRYLEEFTRLLGTLRQDGLILDVRGNGGGLITFGERMLQLLTPKAIDPARFSFLSSVRTRQITANQEFAMWRNSIAQWIETGAQYSQGFPILPIAEYNNIGQKYQGPLVLVTDALCYSTTDIFAAGFQDHGIGVVLGVDESTGAGGANVWDYALISHLLDDKVLFPEELPGRASIRVAVRRVTRVGINSGLLLEDLGVKADEVHQVTRRDLLERDKDLLEHAASILRKGSAQKLTVTIGASNKVQITYQNVDRINAYLDNRPLSSLSVQRSSQSRQKPLTIPKRKRTDAARRCLRLDGFRTDARGQDDLVVATRLNLP